MRGWPLITPLLYSAPILGSDTWQRYSAEILGGELVGKHAKLWLQADITPEEELIDEYRKPSRWWWRCSSRAASSWPLSKDELIDECR